MTDQALHPLATTLLRNCWYLAVQGKYLKKGKMLAKSLLGEPVVLGRTEDGKVFAMRNICPHRGIPLSYGWLEGCDLRCCYHGWKYNTQSGQCTEIPSVTERQGMKIDRIIAKTYPCQEVHGNVWIFVAEDGKAPATLPPVPTIPDFALDARPNVAVDMTLKCNMDHAVMGLMDPSHADYVHTSWWWRGKKSGAKKKKHETVKPYEPAPPHGFRMLRYSLKDRGAKPYKIFGDNVSTEITFQLPGVRIEHIKGDRHHAVALTAITPINDREAEVHQFLYWSVPWLWIIQPIARSMVKTFLGQDSVVMNRQIEGLVHKPSLLLISDADTQARWYLALKKEYEESQREGRPFANPVKPQTLYYHS